MNKTKSTNPLPFFASLLSLGLALTFLLQASPAVWAAESDEDCTAQLISKPTTEQLVAEAKEFFPFVEANLDREGLSFRGFVGSKLPNIPEVAEIALQHGFDWWGLKFNFVPTIEAGIEHRLKVRAYKEKIGQVFTDVTMSGLYILGSESELGLQFAPDAKAFTQMPVSPAVVKTLMARGAYQIEWDGKVTYVTPEHLNRYIDPNTMKYAKVDTLPGAFGLNSISQSGWSANKLHGIHDYSKWRTTDTAKKLKKLAQKLAARGFTMRFNHDYKAALDMLATQVRSYRDHDPESSSDSKAEAERKTHGIEANRYHDENLYKEALARLTAGQGYSAELYNESGKLVGGEIGFRTGNHVYGDSIFYDTTYTREKDGVDGIELAKVATLALMEVLDDAGMTYSDPGMVTAYTNSMGGYLVPFQEYREKIKSGPKELIELPAVWNPLPANYTETALAEVARKRSQGVTLQGFIGRLPLVNDEALALAPGFKLARVEVKMVVVPNETTAQALAAQIPDGQQPIFVISSATVVPGVTTAAEALSRIYGSDQTPELRYTPFARYSNQLQKIGAENFKTQLALDLLADPLIWDQIPGIDYPVISVRGWGLPKK